MFLYAAALLKSFKPWKMSVPITIVHIQLPSNYGDLGVWFEDCVRWANLQAFPAQGRSPPLSTYMWGSCFAFSTRRQKLACEAQLADNYEISTNNQFTNIFLFSNLFHRVTTIRFPFRFDIRSPLVMVRKTAFGTHRPATRAGEPEVA